MEVQNGEHADENSRTRRYHKLVFYLVFLKCIDCCT